MYLSRGKAYFCTLKPGTALANRLSRKWYRSSCGPRAISWHGSFRFLPFGSQLSQEVRLLFCDSLSYLERRGRIKHHEEGLRSQGGLRLQTCEQKSHLGYLLVKPSDGTETPRENCPLSPCSLYDRDCMKTWPSAHFCKTQCFSSLHFW